jgi:hypothetical protein
MSHPIPDPINDANLRQRALSRWDNDGGAGPDGPDVASAIAGDTMPVSAMVNIELMALHVRMIALENMVIALLAATSDQQLDLAREMAAYISPRPGCIQHPLTVRAAAHMIDLAERSSRFRNGA